MKAVLSTFLLALGLATGSSQLVASNCPDEVARMAASEWERTYLVPKAESRPLEDRFRKGPLFYDIAQHLGAGLNSTSFSNELPTALLSLEIRERFSERFFALRTPDLYQIPEVIKLERDTSPVRAPLNLTNFALGLRNVLVFPIEALHAYTTAMETGPWVPRMRQFHKRPNFAFFETYLVPGAPTLSPLGARFAAELPGKTFLDLASGDRNRAVANRAVAQWFGAKDYVAVDMNHIGWRRTWRGEYPQLGGDPRFTARYVKDDILSLVRRLKNPEPLFIRIEGLEAYGWDDQSTAHDYMKEVMAELQRVTRPGDVLSVGRVVSFLQPKGTNSGTDDPPTIDPSDYGFRLTEGTPPQEGRYKSGQEYLWIKD